MIALVILGLLCLIGFGGWCLYMAWGILQVGFAYGDWTALVAAAVFLIVGCAVLWAGYWLMPFKFVMPVYS